MWLSKVEDKSDGEKRLLEFCFLRKEKQMGIPMGGPAAPAEV